jgi:phosphatidylinositol alpha-1,6-mannosyltransferase
MQNESNGPDIPRTLLVTNDFPPRIGGVQQYEGNVVRHLPPDRVSVLAPRWEGWRDHDRAQPFPIHRWPARFMWPTEELARRVRGLALEHGAGLILFGQGLPLALLGPDLMKGGVPYGVLTHGVELWMSRLPAARAALKRALAGAGAVTAISRHTAEAIRPAVPEGVPFAVIPPGVDERRFSPEVDGSATRDRLGIGSRPAVLCVSRLVARKGQDVLIRGFGTVRSLVPDAVLVIAGGGPEAGRLRTLALDEPAGSVVFAGEVPDGDLPGLYAACDVFAMPCRSRWAGLEVEGFGIVFLEAAAAGRPVVAGRSGGAAEAVLDGKTGLVVEGREPKSVALAVAKLLRHPELARHMGQAGRARVEAEFTWRRQAGRLAEVLRRAVSEPQPAASSNR